MNSHAVRPDSPLSVAEVYADVWQTLIAHWPALMSAVALPVAGEILLTGWLLGMSAENGDAIDQVILFSSLLRLLFGVWIAVACHRITLLGPRSLANAWAAYASRPHMAYLGWAVLGAIAAWLVSLALFVLLISVQASEAPSDDGLPRLWGNPATLTLALTTTVALVYVASRLALVLPAAAVGHMLGPISAWRISTGNGWRLVACQILPILALFPVLLTVAVFAEPESAVSEVIATLVSLPVLVVTLIALSCAYRRLTAPPAEGNDSGDAVA